MTMLAPYRSRLHPARAGFARLLRAEWAKFWTVRAWLLVLAVAAAVIVVISQLGASGSIDTGGGDLIAGPDGTVVNDSFRFTHRPLTGDGSITVRATGLKGEGGLEPWAKAGIIVKKDLRPGSPYAAVLGTPDHGVRMQWNFTHDTAGSTTDVVSSPRWLRLTRKGDLLTGYESPDGRTWTKITEVRLDGLPRTAEVGLFVATPDHQELHRSFGGTSEMSGGGKVTGTFDQLSLRGVSAAARWTSTDVSGPVPAGAQEGETGRTAVSASGAYTLTGHSGDIAPNETVGDTVQMSFQGVFVGVLFMVALGALFVTSEYKRGLIRTTFTATPGRVRVLAAKTLVIATVTFVVGLIATALAFPLAQSRLRSNGYKPPVFPDYSLLDATALRAIVGSAILLSLVAVLALAVGVLLRSSAGTIATVLALVILPQILAFALPLPTAHWLLRLTPAAAYAIQQGLTYYPQVQHNCLPESGCYPMTPWNGLLVLVVYAAAALLLAAWRLRRRDVR